MFNSGFETDFTYGQASSSDSRGPLAGGGTSGRGYRNTVTGGHIRGSDGPGRNDSERRNNYRRRNHNERHRDYDNRGRDTLRDNLRDIAVETLQILDDGEYFPPGQDGPYDLKAKIRWAEENTRYYGPDAGDGGEISESEFSAASNPYDTVSPDPPRRATLDNDQTKIYFGEYSTLVGARKVYLALARNTNPFVNKKIGVLNFASAKKPGGEYINGSKGQEESLARASTLYPSLITEAASQFYTNYHKDPSNAYYTHAMVYSPGIVLIRDDKGEWRSPVEVDVLTSAAVNAGDIRRELERGERVRMERVEMEYWKKIGEGKRMKKERAIAEMQRQKEEKAERQRQMEENKKAKEEIEKLEKEQANMKEEIAKLKILVKEMGKRKETDKGKAKDSGGGKEEKAIAEVENGDEKGEEVESEKPEENQDNAIDILDSGLAGCGSDGPLKSAEENAESSGTLVHDDQPQPKAPPEVNQKLTFSSTVAHLLSPPTQRSQARSPDPNLTYALALKNAEIQIEHTMYARISRILHLFQLHQTPHLILGSFGTGVSKNRTDLIASIFADLLIKPGGRFKDVFQTVVFAILGKETVRVFTEVLSSVDKRAQMEGTSKSCVFVDSSDSEGWDSYLDVKEGDEEKRMRMMKWKARRSERRHIFM